MPDLKPPGAEEALAEHLAAVRAPDIHDIPAEYHTTEYARKRLGEIRSREYPNGDTIQLVADVEWLIDEAQFLRDRLARLPRW